MTRSTVAGLLVLLLTGGAALLHSAPSGPDWLQWALDAQHSGHINVQGQLPNRILADIVYDPLVPQELKLSGGDLLVHYQVPLVEGNDVYMESKTGAYSAGAYATQSWHEDRYSWTNGQLTKVWTFDSDWKAPGSPRDFWEPVFHATLANGFLYVPGAGGTVFKVNKADGSAVRRINPFGVIDQQTFTVSPITADAAGNLYYNVLKVHSSVPFYNNDAADSWLVRIAPDDSVRTASYTTLLAGTAPASSDLCYATFSTSQLPWPPSPDAIPPQVSCGLQRVALNIAPALAPDGTIYSVTRAHFISRYGYLVAINPNLTLKWATPLRGAEVGPDGTYFTGGYMPNGCNDGSAYTSASLYPRNGDTAHGGCRAGARPGVDPAVNRLGGGRVIDDSSSTPVVAPDGSIFYGAFSRYNYDQGSMMHFSSTGQFLGYFSFGWDTTPAIYAHDGTYSVVIKNNHYGGIGSYCEVEQFCPSDRSASNPASPEAYFVTQLSPVTDPNNGSMLVEWSFQNTNTESCSRNPDGSISCVSDHPFSFEWCVNAFVVDRTGKVYANSEDGNLYVISQGGILAANLFQQLALGAAYTPTSMGGDGKIYTQNAGHLFVVAQ